MIITINLHLVNINNLLPLNSYFYNTTQQNLVNLLSFTLYIHLNHYQIQQIMKTIPAQDISVLLQKLSSCKQSISALQKTQRQLIQLISSSHKEQLLTHMNSLVDKLHDKNFTQVFGYLINDSEFIHENQQQLIQFLIDKLTLCENGLSNISKQKKLLVMELLLNRKTSSQQGNTFANILIQHKCRTDLNFCHSFLYNLNSTLSSLTLQETSQYNLNHCSVLAIKVVKNWNKLPQHLVDEALRFITTILLPKIITQSNENIQELKQIYDTLMKSVTQIISSNSHKSGNAYRFIGLYLEHYHNQKTIHNQNDLFEVLTLCSESLLLVFPQLLNLESNALQNEIQKIHQFYLSPSRQNNLNTDMKDQQSPNFQPLKTRHQNQENKIQMNLRLSLLRGISFFVSRFFLFLNQQNNQNSHQLARRLLENGSIDKYKNVFELLSYCNDNEMFCNFIEVIHKRQTLKQLYRIEINITQQHLFRQIIRNCPTPTRIISYTNSNHLLNRSQIQQSQVIQCLKKIFDEFLTEQGKLHQILKLIKEKIQKQYDQAFNVRQFQCACNTLTLLFRVTNQQRISINNFESVINDDKKQSQCNLSKQQIIEWVKMFLNLNESCIPIHRPLIVTKTYQFLAEVFHIVLPGNHYLQQVVETQLITNSYPQRKQFLEKLIALYFQQGDNFFQTGYINKTQSQRIANQIHSLKSNMQINIDQIQKQDENEEINSVGQKLSSGAIKRFKLLDRLYNKLQQNQLNLNHKKHMWTLISKVYNMESKAQNQFGIQIVHKLFSNRPDILLARHLSGRQIGNQEYILPQKQLHELSKHFKEYPYFYKQELEALKL